MCSHNEDKALFFVTQLQTLVLAIVTTGLMQLSNHLAIYLIYCCPVYFFLVLLEYFIFWTPHRKCSCFYHCYNILIFFVCFPIFFGIFFGIFHPTASLEFTQVQNCQMIGSLTDSILNLEKYSIHYVNFEFQGQQYLGAACSSNLSKGSTSSPLMPYLFYYKYDRMSCLKGDGNKTDPNDVRILLENHLNYDNSTERNLSTEDNVNDNPNSRSGNNNEYNNHGIHSFGRFSSVKSTMASGKSCTSDYLWSKVKIASWLCMDRGFDEQSMMQPQSCYVNFFSGEKSYDNGLSRAPMKDQYNFPLIAYKPHAYYPQIDVVCLIVFSYYCWILSFNTIFQFTAKRILKLKSRSTFNQAQITAFNNEVSPPQPPPPPSPDSENQMMMIDHENFKDNFPEENQQEIQSTIQPTNMRRIQVKQNTDEFYQQYKKK